MKTSSKLSRVFVLLLFSMLSLDGMSRENASSQLDSCVDLMNRGDYQMAIVAADRLVKLVPDNPLVYHVKAVSRLRLYDYRQAISDAERTIQCRADFLGAYEVSAMAALELRDWELAERSCAKGLVLNPTNQNLLRMQGRIADARRAENRSNVITACFSALLLAGFGYLIRRRLRSETTWNLISAIGISGVVALLLYSGFYFFSTQIWSMNQRLNLNEVLPQSKIFIYEHDGIEGYVLFGMMILIVAVSFLAAWAQGVFKTVSSSRVVLAVTVLACICYLWTVGFYPPETSVATGLTTSILASVALLTVCSALNVLSKRHSLAALAVLSVILIPVCFISIEAVSIYDYSFVLSPALRLLQGASIKDIYLQYDLLMSMIAAVWIKTGMLLERIEVVGQASMYIFFLSLFVFSKRFFNDSRLAAFLIAVVVLVRIYANMHMPSTLLQVTSLRLDWWLLLLFLVRERGYQHWSIGLSLGALLLFHKNFGLLYLAAYLCLLVTQLVFDVVGRKRVESSGEERLPVIFIRHLRGSALNLGILGLFMMVTMLVFGGIRADSAMMYQRVGLGMIPISQVSFYWLMPIVFSLVTMLIWKNIDRLTPSYVQTGVFLVFLAIASSMYFFGRSHENNIINISSILLLVLFVLFDLISFSYRPAGTRHEKSTSSSSGISINFTRNAGLLLSVLLLFGVSYFYSDKMPEKFAAQWKSLKTGRWRLPIAGYPIDAESVKQIVDDPSKVYVLDYQRDFLYYYQGGYALSGYFNPCGVWILRPDLVTFLNGLLKQGYNIVIPSPTSALDVLQRLDYNVMKSANGTYAVSNRATMQAIEGPADDLLNVSFSQQQGTTRYYRQIALKSDSFTLELLFEPRARQQSNASVFSIISDEYSGMVLEATGRQDGEFVLASGSGETWKMITLLQADTTRANRLVINKRGRNISVALNGSNVFTGADPSDVDFTSVNLTVGAPFGRENVMLGSILGIRLSDKPRSFSYLDGGRNP